MLSLKPNSITYSEIPAICNILSLMLMKPAKHLYDRFISRNIGDCNREVFINWSKTRKKKTKLGKISQTTRKQTISSKISLKDECITDHRSIYLRAMQGCLLLLHHTWHTCVSGDYKKGFIWYFYYHLDYRERKKALQTKAKTKSFQ